MGTVALLGKEHSMVPFTLRAVLVAACLLPAMPLTAAAARPLVAVFAVELDRVAGRPGIAERLTSHLASRLAAGGQFAVVPEERLKRAIAKRRELCHTQACQIEVGQELAAQLALDTQIHRLGSGCVVMSNLYELRSATIGSGATARGSCAEPELLKLLDGVAARLARASRRTAAIDTPEAAELLLLGSPAGAQVSLILAGKSRNECRLPCRFAPLTPAVYELEVRAPGHLDLHRTVTIGVGRVTALSLDLRRGKGRAPPASRPPPAADRPEEPAAPLLSQGLALSPITPKSRARHDLPEQVNFGVVINRVPRGSCAARCDLHAGDVILEVNGVKIETVAGFRRAVGPAPRGLRLLLHRGGKSFTMRCAACR